MVPYNSTTATILWDYSDTTATSTTNFHSRTGLAISTPAYRIVHQVINIDPKVARARQHDRPAWSANLAHEATRLLQWFVQAEEQPTVPHGSARSFGRQGAGTRNFHKVGK